MEREALWASFAARHAEALYEAAERKERVYRENPALGRLDQEITEAGARYCAAMAKGEDTPVSYTHLGFSGCSAWRKGGVIRI